MGKFKVLIIGCGRVAVKHLKAIDKNKDRAEDGDGRNTPTERCCGVFETV